MSRELIRERPAARTPGKLGAARPPDERREPTTTAVDPPRSQHGRPLTGSERAFFEPRLGHDLGAVRIHADPAAREFSRGLAARAVTIGSDIFCRDGMPALDDEPERELLGHELAHVAQHRAHRATAPVPVDPADSAAERDAAHAAGILARGGAVGVLPAVATPVAHRSTDVELGFKSEPAPAHGPRPEIVDSAVAAMSTVDKFLEAIRRAEFGHALGDRLDELKDPKSLALMTLFVGATIVMQGTPIGWLIDVAGTAWGIYSLGMDGVAVVKHLMAFCDKAANATSVADLDEAGEHLATACATVAVDLVVAFLLRKLTKPGATESPVAGEAPTPPPERVVISHESILGREPGAPELVPTRGVPPQPGPGRPAGPPGPVPDVPRHGPAGPALPEELGEIEQIGDSVSPLTATAQPALATIGAAAEGGGGSVVPPVPGRTKTTATAMAGEDGEGGGPEPPAPGSRTPGERPGDHPAPAETSEPTPTRAPASIGAPAPAGQAAPGLQAAPVAGTPRSYKFVPGFGEREAQVPPPAGWEFTDHVKVEPDHRSVTVTTFVTAPGGQKGSMTRGYAVVAGQGTLLMPSVNLQSIPKDARMLPTDPKMVPGEGTPLEAYMTTRQMKIMAGVVGEGWSLDRLHTVFMSPITNARTILEFARLTNPKPPMPPMPPEEAILQTHSVQYAKNSIVQSGRRIVSVTVSGGATKPASSLLVDDATLRKYGIGPNDEVLTDFTITITVEPAPGSAEP
jgi:hypothetical protein